MGALKIGIEHVCQREVQVAPDGWMTLMIGALDNRFMVLVNDEVVVDHIDASRFSHRREPLTLDSSENTRVEFRKLEFKNLSPENVSPSDAQAPPSLEQNEFRALFNGKDLTGWRSPSSGPAKRWTVKDGVLSGRDGPEHLFTAKPYANFHLRAEVRINEGGDSGIYFRVKPEEIKEAAPSCCEAQIASGGRGQRTGSLEVAFNYVDGKDPFVPHDEWCMLEIIAEGDRITLLVNGKKPLSMSNASSATAAA
jgi:hypothetical protein